ncbi:MAG TPA: hypothetical protein ENM98_01255, partial [Halothiobacillaceae bacterium]|nr:hypothetical protein [Halothiobacillaceae bacterium]
MSDLYQATGMAENQLCKQFGDKQVDWLLAARTLKSTVADQKVRREMRLAGLKDLTDSLILCARREQRRALLSILPRIYHEIEREKQHPSADLSRLNRLLRYFERVASQQEQTDSTMDSKALILGSEFLPEVAEAALHRAGFEPKYLDSFTQCIPWPSDARAMIFHHKPNAAPRLTQMKNLLKMLPGD